MPPRTNATTVSLTAIACGAPEALMPRAVEQEAGPGRSPTNRTAGPLARHKTTTLTAAPESPMFGRPACRPFPSQVGRG
ncbi:hypothetical protein GCM10010430_51200 [Kitasatospora cystarginea]|uniref:Secreted protein n=1 Tax=Kitasatospora cystarginea TaxID=58350 RepID=A0ABN3EJG3_9ACTN